MTVKKYSLKRNIITYNFVVSENIKPKNMAIDVQIRHKTLNGILKSGTGSKINNGSPNNFNSIICSFFINGFKIKIGPGIKTPLFASAGKSFILKY